MIKFKLFRYPVQIELTFLFILLIFGSSFLQRNDIGGFVEVSLILLVSILVHEFGHAMAFRYYKIDSRILIHGLGGLCIPSTGRLTPKDNMFVCLCGPFAGFALAIVYYLADKAGLLPETALPAEYRSYLVYFINIGWGIFNLLPIYPLDGGQSLYNFLKWRKISNSLKKALKVSIVCLTLIGAYALFRKEIFILVLCGWFLYENIQKWNSINAGNYSE